jgi:CRISPR/Cas system-associated exonuclease Cas4 (RecB family)
MSNNPEKLVTLRLSVSKAKTFSECKKKFEFSYVLKLPKKEMFYHTFGKFMHKVLEDFHKIYLENLPGYQDPYHITIASCFKAAREEYKKDMTPEMLKEAYDLTNKYLKIVSKDKKDGLVANVIAVERNFELNIDDKVVLNGMIDRVQLDSDQVIHVADYKTSKNKKYLVNDFFQLLTYAYIIISENPDIDKVRASYIMLRHDFEYITKEFKRDEILAMKDKFLNYAEMIKEEKDYPATITALCPYCDFNQSCGPYLEKQAKSMKYGEVEW